MGYRKLPYHEGTIFGVPLDDHTHAIGLVARSGARGRIVLGYFFGAKWQTLPGPAVFQRVKKSEAVLTCMFGDLGLINGDWPIIGELVDFSRADWPLPVFSRIDGISAKESLIHYSDDDLFREISCVPRNPGDNRQYPKDGLFGSRALEIYLSRGL